MKKKLIPNPSADLALKVGSALENDLIGRKPFAAEVVSQLSSVSPFNGLAISIEGTWGSGKTSVLSIIEELLLEHDEDAVIVRFNPWLIGDRDALLTEFLHAISSKLSLGSPSRALKNVASKLSAYSGAFDVLRLIPGAEPMASIVKAVVKTMGGAADDIGDLHTPSIEDQRAKAFDALSKLKKRIVVLIDDIDRLYPAEVFEMIRIVKSVADLPNIGYVLALDPSYASDSLRTLGVPRSDSYLDKIIQVRLTLPEMSYRSRERLMNEALKSLPPEALEKHFPGDSELPRCHISIRCIRPSG